MLGFWGLTEAAKCNILFCLRIFADVDDFDEDPSAAEAAASSENFDDQETVEADEDEEEEAHLIFERYQIAMAPILEALTELEESTMNRGPQTPHEVNFQRKYSRYETLLRFVYYLVGKCAFVFQGFRGERCSISLLRSRSDVWARAVNGGSSVCSSCHHVSIVSLKSKTHVFCCKL